MIVQIMIYESNRYKFLKLDVHACSISFLLIKPAIRVYLCGIAIVASCQPLCYVHMMYMYWVSMWRVVLTTSAKPTNCALDDHYQNLILFDVASSVSQLFKYCLQIALWHTAIIIEYCRLIIPSLGHVYSQQSLHWWSQKSQKQIILKSKAQYHRNSRI